MKNAEFRMQNGGSVEFSPCLFHSSFFMLHSKDGGLPRCCPVLCPESLRGCITAMLTTRRNAKAELNRRSQACDVLAGTGISRRVKWPPSHNVGEGGSRYRLLLLPKQAPHF
jgi:hypothetical protein